MDPNKDCSYSEGSTRTPAFVWVGLDCICRTVSSIPDQCALALYLRQLVSDLKQNSGFGRTLPPITQCATDSSSFIQVFGV